MKLLQVPEEFPVFVKYEQPYFTELARRFPRYINADYRRHHFEPIECCANVSKANRWVIFEYVYLSRRMSNADLLAEIDLLGLRPALYEELLSFNEEYPDELKKRRIIALGSQMRVHGRGRGVAHIWNEGEGQALSVSRVTSGWNQDYHFLVVRK